MENARYMISDAANIVNVESHVLRYWEEELELAIPRNGAPLLHRREYSAIPKDKRMEGAGLSVESHSDDDT